MTRRRFITKGRLTAAALVAGLLIILVESRSAPEGSYQGHSTSYWLREILYAGERQTKALQAFNNMGASADPRLMAALAEKEKPFNRFYRSLWDRMPTALQQHLPNPDEPPLLQMAAVVVFQRAASSRIIPDLYPMLKDSDSAVRQAVLNATKGRVPNAGQISWLVLAGNDPDQTVRQDVWNRLGETGSAATNAVPAILKLCGDPSVDVRQGAAWALWKITHQTNTALPVLETALSQQPQTALRHLGAYHLLFMGDSSPFFVNTLVNSLTNRQAGDRAIVCAFLGQIGPPAAAAIPALRKALQDPEPEVRRRAEVALSKIEPSQSAAHSP